MPEAGAPRRSGGFLLRFALANAGGVIGYVPLLTLLLPLKVELLAGEARIGVLTACALAGAVAASLANVLFGALSDRGVARGGGRRRWIAGGIVATAAGYAAILAAATPLQIVLAIVGWQIAINAMLAPLMAIMAEEIPDAQKGVAGGLLSLANPVALVMSALLVAAAMLGEAARYAIVCAGVALLAAPLLATPARIVAEPPRAAERTMRRLDLALVWLARLSAQIAGSVLFLYLLFYFESLAPAVPVGVLAPQVGNASAIAFALPLPAALLIGRLSDRVGKRKPFILAAAAAMSAGLATMALAHGWFAAVGGLAVFACGQAVFLGLVSAFAMQILPSARHRGRDLGLINLANTLPSLIGPVLAWFLSTTHDFGVLFACLAVLTLAAGALMLPVRSER